MNNRAVLFLFLAFSLVACGQVTTVSTATPTVTVKPSLTLTATITVSPTASVTASPTAFPTLSAEKPYLMLKQGYDNQGPFIYDASGNGRQVVELPADAKVTRASYQLHQSVSPNGEWLAFYTGSADYLNVLDLPLTLKLFHTTDGTIKKVADVVTDETGEKLSQVAEQLKQSNPKYYQVIDGDDWVYGSLISTFKDDIHAVAWSPDGRTLAFAAQIDGISSDVYLYDLETGIIQQAEESLENVARIRWSPDGKYILLWNAFPGYIYNYGSSLHAVKVGGLVVREPKKLYGGTWMHIGDWLAPNLLLVSDGSDTGGNHSLKTIDIRTGQINTLWKKAVGSYAIDQKNKIIAINTGEFMESGWELSFVSFDGRQRKILDGIYYLSLFFRGGEKNRFLASGLGNGKPYNIDRAVIGMDLNGEPTVLREYIQGEHISIAPDKLWLVMFDEQNLFVYDRNDQLVRTIAAPGIYQLLWRPDSRMIFYSTYRELYALTIPDGKPKLVDVCGSSDCSFTLDNAIWLP